MVEPQFAPFEPLPPPRATNRWFTWVVLLAVLAGFLIVVVAPNFQRPHRNTLTACRSNLKNIGTALEMYATDNQGRYPKRLELLVGNYLKVIPTCPAAQDMTYIDYRCSLNPDAYTVHCVGDNHVESYRSLAPGSRNDNYPGYSSYLGLIEPK